MFIVSLLNKKKNISGHMSVPDTSQSAEREFKKNASNAQNHSKWQ